VYAYALGEERDNVIKPLSVKQAIAFMVGEEIQVEE